MKKFVCMFLLFCFVPMAFGADLILLRNGQQYRGQVTKIVEKGFVVKTIEGNVIVIPKSNIAKIYRDNKVLDFESGESYYLERKRPFLPFIVLSVATGAYAVRKYQDYQDNSKKSKEEVVDTGQSDLQNFKDQSKKDLAWSIGSGLFCIGSLYVAFKPIEVKVPIGKINLSATPNRVMLSLEF